MSVEVTDVRDVTDPETGELMAHHVELRLDGPQGAYLWRHGAVPLGFTREQARQYIEAHFDEMYARAVANGEVAPDILDNSHIDRVRVVKALALVMLDSVNALRVRAGLTELTTEQLVSAVRTKYIELGE